MALEELGPTFIKLGQLLSTRPDLIPLEYVQELSELQDNVSPFSFNEVETIIKTEFGKGPGEIFEHFEVNPIAAASIAQVHRARLYTGNEVVVKIQRPNLRETLEVLAKSLDSNFEIYGYLELYFKRFHLRKYDPRKIIQELRISGADLARVVKEIPMELRNILKYIREGNLKVQFEHKGLDSLIHSNEQISNRIAFAIVLAALIVGSSLIIHADVPPRWNDIPIVGLFGFIIAGIMEFWLLITIIKHGKM